MNLIGTVGIILTFIGTVFGILKAFPNQTTLMFNILVIASVGIITVIIYLFYWAHYKPFQKKIEEDLKQKEEAQNRIFRELREFSKANKESVALVLQKTDKVSEQVNSLKMDIIQLKSGKAVISDSMSKQILLQVETGIKIMYEGNYKIIRKEIEDKNRDKDAIMQKCFLYMQKQRKKGMVWAESIAVPIRILDIINEIDQLLYPGSERDFFNITKRAIEMAETFNGKQFDILQELMQTYALRAVTTWVKLFNEKMERLK